MSDYLLSDFISKLTGKKQFDGNKYKFYQGYKNKKKALEIKKELEGTVGYNYSRRIKPIVYDTKWTVGKRYKLFIPIAWELQNV